MINICSTITCSDSTDINFQQILKFNNMSKRTIKEEKQYNDLIINFKPLFINTLRSIYRSPTEDDLQTCFCIFIQALSSESATGYYSIEIIENRIKQHFCREWYREQQNFPTEELIEVEMQKQEKQMIQNNLIEQIQQLNKQQALLCYALLVGWTDLEIIKNLNLTRREFETLRDDAIFALKMSKIKETK